MALEHICSLLTFVSIIASLQYTDFFSIMHTRKLVHMIAGTFAIITPNTIEYRVMNVCIAIAMISIVWFFPKKLKFARPKDKGILCFGLLVCIWSIFDFDFRYFAPTIYADPIGAIAGNIFPVPKLYKSKTVSSELLFIKG
ncbi:phosphatidate cytidylyltransferase [Cryptosporidium felis]|nr:phosphatidate cytidylyltransferase [Cryptosporidium felis]